MARRPAKPSGNVRSVTALDNAIGQRIRAARLRLGLSQSTLGDRLGVSFQQIQKYEKGLNRVSPGRMVAICQTLGITVEDIFGTSKTTGGLQHDTFMTTAEGAQIIKAMIKLSKAQQRSVINLARSFAGG